MAALSQLLLSNSNLCSNLIKLSSKLKLLPASHAAAVTASRCLRFCSSSSSSSTLPNSADYVIIGGGSIGCSLLYHLSKLQAGSCVLLEKEALTAGTTWHTAGLVWQLRPSDTDMSLLQYGWDLIRSLEEETDISTGFIQNGGLFTASCETRMQEYKQLHTLGKLFGIESHLLTPSEMQQLHPLMRVSDLVGGLHSPGDGTVEPAGYCAALVKAARANGAQVYEGCEVTGIDTHIDDFGVRRIKRVRTNRGDIHTQCVVNAAGVWAPSTGALAQVTVPQVSAKHAYVVTERIGSLRGLPNIRDHDASVYLRVQGDAFCVGGYEPAPTFLESAPADFAFSLFDLDWDVFAPNIDGAVNRVPAVADAGVKSTVCGPESFTPDGRPLLGEAPELFGFYHASGFNSGGMMYSAGCAKQLAHCIVKGHTDIDMFSFDVKRFSSELARDASWVKERSHEHYAKHYSLHFHHDQPLAGRRATKRGALHRVLLERGCVYEERHGFERPGWFAELVAEPLEYRYYGNYNHKQHAQDLYADYVLQDSTYNLPVHESSIRAECLACRNSAAIFDMSYFGKFHIVGKDAAAAADWIFSANMRREAGSTVYSCVLNEEGGVEADVTVTVIEPGVDYYVAVGGAAKLYVKHLLMRHIADHRWQCSVIDRSSEQSILSIQGPQSRSILSQLTNCNLSNASFAPGQCQQATVANCPVLLLRVSFVGELGWELHVANEFAADVYAAVMRVGDGCLVNAGYRAMDSLSCEKGYRLGHHDLRSHDSPIDCGLAFTCKLKSGIDFIGRAALINRRRDRSINRLITLQMEPGLALHGQELVKRDGVIVGFVRRCEQAYWLGCTLGVGWVQCEAGVSADWLRGGIFTIERMGVEYRAEAMLRSPFDPKGRRILGDYSG